MQKITPFLWFDHQAEEAAHFYTSIFPNSRMGKIVRYGDEGTGQEGTVMTVSFELFGQEFVALNGGPHFSFTPAVSFFVNCETQQEIDHYWEKLTEGGNEEMCGWLRDKYGVSWQIVPGILDELMNDPNADRAGRVRKALLQMVKLDIAGLKQAYEGQDAI